MGPELYTPARYDQRREEELYEFLIYIILLYELALLKHLFLYNVRCFVS